MGIKMTTPMSVIDDFINDEIQRIHFLTIRALCSLGEQCVIKVRTSPSIDSWCDDTGNLRSSVGYVVVHNGVIVNISNFEQVREGAEGAKEGKTLAEKLAKSYKRGYVLIVVAGMNYASYVEAIENKVVLSSAELFARREFPKMLENLKNQIAR